MSSTMHVYHRSHQHKSTAFHYLILILILATGFSSFVKVTGESARQLQVATVTGVAYFFWGVFHHMSIGDLNWKVVVEYASIAFLAVGLLWVLLLPVS